MNQIKRLSGWVWMLLGPAALYLLLKGVISLLSNANSAIEKAATPAAKAAAEAARNNLLLQWGILIVVFIPIIIGLVIFGKYAVAGAYDTHAKS
jgi:uncharacterized membrane protein